MTENYTQKLVELEKQIAVEYGIIRNANESTLPRPYSDLVAYAFRFHFPQDARPKDMHEKMTRVLNVLNGQDMPEGFPTRAAYRGLAIVKVGPRVTLAPLISTFIKEKHQVDFADFKKEVKNRSPYDYEIISAGMHVPLLGFFHIHNNMNIQFFPQFRVTDNEHDLVIDENFEIQDIHDFVFDIKTKVSVDLARAYVKPVDFADLRVEPRLSDSVPQKGFDGKVATVGEYVAGKLVKYIIVDKKPTNRTAVKPETLTTIKAQNPSVRFIVNPWFDYEVRSSLFSINGYYVWEIDAGALRFKTESQFGHTDKIAAMGTFRNETHHKHLSMTAYTVIVDDLKEPAVVRVIFEVMRANYRNVYDITVDLFHTGDKKPVADTKVDIGFNAFWLSIGNGTHWTRLYLDIEKPSTLLSYDNDARSTFSFIKNSSDFLSAGGAQLRLDIRDKYTRSPRALDFVLNKE